MASPATTPPTIAPTFDSVLTAAAEVGVEVAEVVGVEVTEVGEVVEVKAIEVVIVGLVEVAPLVDAATVDIGTGVDSGPPEMKISECIPIRRQTYLHS